MSRTIPSSQYETNLWSTHVNTVRLSLRSLAKSRGLSVSVSFLPSSKTNIFKFQFDLERIDTFKRVHKNSLGPVQTLNFSWAEPNTLNFISWKVWRLNQLGTSVSIWNGSAVLFAWPCREFRLWSDIKHIKTTENKLDLECILRTPWALFCI